MKLVGISYILCVHIHWVTSPFMIMSIDAYTMLMMMIMPRMMLGGLLTSRHLAMDNQLDCDGFKGVNRLGTHACMCWLCVGKYYTSYFVRTGGHVYNGFNDRFLSISYMYFHSLTSTVGSLIEYFLKYSSNILPLFQVKAKHPCTSDDNITSKDHDTNIRQ